MHGAAISIRPAREIRGFFSCLPNDSGIRFMDFAAVCSSVRKEVNREETISVYRPL
jgi:hypothetical protein